MKRPIQFATIEQPGHALVQLGWRPRWLSRKRRADDWLKIHGRVKRPEGEWKFRDECLTVEEARSLVDWLNGLPNAEPRELRFLEPCLSFESLGLRGPDIGLRIVFRGEAAPPWIQEPEEVWRNGYPIDLYAPTRSIAQFADSLGRLLDAK